MRNLFNFFYNMRRRIPVFVKKNKTLLIITKKGTANYCFLQKRNYICNEISRDRAKT